MQPRTRRWVFGIVGALVVLALAGVAAMHFAARSVKEAIEQALGPEGEATEINVRLTSIELIGVRIRAPKDWPTDTAVRAPRVVIFPDLRELLSDRVRITSIDIEQGYLAAVRPKEGGGLRVLPHLAERAKNEKPTGKKERGVSVGSVALTGSVVEVFDRSVIGKAQRVRFDAVKGTIEDLSLPDLATRTRINLDGIIKGVNHQGTVAVRGWMEIASKDAELETKVRNVDLALFEPYLVSKTKSGVESGTFALDMKSTVRKNVVHAPGTLTVTKLKLKAADNPLGAIGSLPRRAVLGAMENEQDQISVPFNLEGSLDDPTFSLTGTTALKTGVAVAKAFGMSFEGIARAFLIIIHGLGGAFGPPPAR